MPYVADGDKLATVPFSSQRFREERNVGSLGHALDAHRDVAPGAGAAIRRLAAGALREFHFLWTQKRFLTNSVNVGFARVTVACAID